MTDQPAPRDDKADPPVLPDRAEGDRDFAWGDSLERDPDERLTREVPPHW